MARYVVRVKQMKVGDGTGDDRRIKIIGRIDFKSKGQKFTLNKDKCYSEIVNGDYTPEEMAEALEKVKKESYALAKSIKLEDGVELQKGLNKKARKVYLDSDNKFI